MMTRRVNNNTMGYSMSDEAVMAKKELAQYRDMKRSIDHLHEKIERIKAKIESVGSGIKSSEIQHQPDQKTIEMLYMSMIDLQMLYGQKMVEAERLCYDLEVRISEVSGVCGLILSKRYILGLSFEKIAYELDYSYRQILRLHRKALEEYAKRWHSMSH